MLNDFPELTHFVEDYHAAFNHKEAVAKYVSFVSLAETEKLIHELKTLLIKAEVPYENLDLELNIRFDEEVDARAWLYSTVKMCESQLKRKYHDTITELEMSATHHKTIGKPRESYTYRLKLEKLYDKLPGYAGERVENLKYLAVLAVYCNELEQAERAARKCLELYLPHAKDLELLATFRWMLAVVLAENRKFDEAVPYGMQALVHYIQAHGERSLFAKTCQRDLERMKNKDAGQYLDRG